MKREEQAWIANMRKSWQRDLLLREITKNILTIKPKSKGKKP